MLRGTSIGLFLAASACAVAAPIPPALDKFYKDGIRVEPGKPCRIQGEVKTKGSWENHLVRLNKGQTYQVDLTAEYPANFRVVNSETGALLFNSDSAKGKFVAPKEGVYRILVGSPAGVTGKYSLSVAHQAIPLVIDPPGVRSVPKEGLSIASNLMVGDAMDKMRKTLCKTFDVRLVAGKNYQIDMMSGAFDCYLRIEDPTGKQIAIDDDGGEGLNSRINLNVTGNGVYRIICTSFGAGTGAFNLQVRER